VTPNSDGIFVRTSDPIPDELKIDHIEGLPITYVVVDA